MKPIPMQPVESSQIHAIGHDPATNTLAIQFRNKGGVGATYHYKNFTADQFKALQGAESVGKHFYAHIKPASEAHPYERVAEPPEPEAEAA